MSQLIRIYVAIMFLIFMFTLWTTCVLFLTFGKIKHWGETVTLATVYPYYVSTIIFLVPYLATLLIFDLDVWYLIDEVDMGGAIEEPDPPADIMDLSDVTLAQTCIFVCAMPCIMCVQLSDLVGAVLRAYNKHYRDAPMISLPRMGGAKKKKKAVVANKSRGFGRRLWKTIVRMFRGSKQKEVRPIEAEFEGENNDLELMDLQKDREQLERMERERVRREEEEKRRARELAEEAVAREAQMKQERALMEAAKALNARKLREEEEARRRAEEQEEKQLEAAKPAEEAWDAILVVPAFKSIWSTLSTAGSFQCKLKALPPLQALVDHLKRQGFHIVFAANPTANDVEIGVCNIRRAAADSWFMARFLATPTSFSAVMKAQNTEEVTGYVKKFALAKVLKIDTAK